MRKKPTTIEQMPDEVLIHIFTFVELAAIHTAKLVQRRWHQLLCDEQFCTTLLLRDFAPFYSNNTDIKSSALPPHALYQRECKVKTIIQCLIFGEIIPKVLRRDDLLWEILYLRMFYKPKQRVSQWQHALYAKAGDLDSETNKIDLLVRSGYADMLQNFIDSITNAPQQIKYTTKSKRVGFREKPVSEQVSQHRLSELINHTSSKGLSPLFLAAFKGHLKIAKILLDHKANVNQATTDVGVTPLFIAAQEGHFATAKLLLDHKANANQAKTTGETPLFIAAGEGYKKIAKLLLDHHADVNQARSNGESPLFMAAAFGHIETVRLLLDCHADVNQASDNGETPLYVAALICHYKIIKLLIENHAEVNKARDTGESPLFIAAYKRQRDIVKLLIQHGADYYQIPVSLIRKYPHVNACYQKAQSELLKEQQIINLKRNMPISETVDQMTQVTSDNFSSLFLAAKEGDIKIVKLLIDQNHANVNQANGDGETSLFIAAQEGHLDIVQLLVDHHANANLFTKNGQSPLFKAAQKGYPAIAELLIKNNANVNQARNDGTTPLYIAAQNRHIEIVKLLLDNNAAINQADTEGESPLFIAAYEGYVDIVKMLIQYGADYNQIPVSLIRNYPEVNACYQKAQSELLKEQQLSSRKQNKQISETIDQVTQVANDDFSQLFLAAKDGDVKTVKLLIGHHHVNVNQANANGATLLFIAAFKGHCDIVQLLLDHHANVNQAKATGATPLFFAAQKGRLDIAKLLLDHHANVNQARNDGATPLYIAAKRGHLDMVKLLILHGADYYQIPAGLKRKYQQVNVCYQKAQSELLKEQQLTKQTQTDFFPRANSSNTNQPTDFPPSANYSESVRESTNRTPSTFNAVDLSSQQMFHDQEVQSNYNDTSSKAQLSYKL